jgi:hypothetical protein
MTGLQNFGTQNFAVILKNSRGFKVQFERRGFKYDVQDNI